MREACCMLIPPDNPVCVITRPLTEAPMMLRRIMEYQKLTDKKNLQEKPVYEADRLLRRKREAQVCTQLTSENDAAH